MSLNQFSVSHLVSDRVYLRYDVIFVPSGFKMTSSGSCESWDIGNLLLNDLAFLRGLQDEIIPKSQNALHYQFIFLSDIQLFTNELFPANIN